MKLEDLEDLEFRMNLLPDIFENVDFNGLSASHLTVTIDVIWLGTIFYYQVTEKNWSKRKQFPIQMLDA